MPGTIPSNEFQRAFKHTGGVTMVAGGPERGLAPLSVGLLAAGAAALSALAVVVALVSPFSDDRYVVAISNALLIATPVSVGLYALRREPSSTVARLLIVAGFAWAPNLLSASSNDVLYSIGRIDGWLLELSLIVLVLAFPTGRLTGRLERLLVAAACVVVAVLYLPSVLLAQHYPTPVPSSACMHDCPSNAFAVTSTEPGIVDSVIEPMRSLLTALLFLGVAVTLSVRLAGASRLMRRTLVPVLTAAIIAMVANAGFLISRETDRWSAASRVLGFVAILAIPGLVVGILLGLLRWRLQASDALRRLVDQFGGGRAGGPDARDMIAAAIRDPSLWIAYWAGDPGRWVDESGAPVTLPRRDPDRAVTEISADGTRVAALVHDAALVGEPAVREVAGGFALMALDNQRLDAELRASLRELRESRARVLQAVDQERVRIERDLHDGAQQRLVALRVGLQLAAETVPSDPDRATELLNKLGTETEQILDAIRALARGVYPPLLADHGIGPAIQAAARESSLATTVRCSGLGRYSQQIESAVYFSCLEALQNAAKHARASTAVVTLAENDDLHFEVRDDGQGFEAHGGAGAGLKNMRDRIVALGGRLAIESAPGEGTRVTGTVPIGVANLTPDVETLLRRATDALEDSFAIFRALRDSNGDVIDFVVEHVNDAACRSTGRPREQQVGRTLGHLDPDYLGSDLFAWHRQALETDGPSSLEDTLYASHSTGRRMTQAHDIRAAPLGAGRLAVNWRDITERKRAERELSLQAAVLERASEGVCLVRSSDGVIVYANPRCAEMYGYELHALAGRRFAELMWEAAPGDAERHAGEILARLVELREASYEVRGKRRDGSPIWTEARAASFEDPEHEDVWVIVQQDVTARREAQAALELSEQRFRAALDGAPVVLFTMDRQLRYSWLFNSGTGVGGDEGALGRTDEEIFGGEIGRTLTQINRTVLAGTPVRSGVDLELHGRRAKFELTVQPQRDAHGEVVGLAGVAYEVTPRARDGVERMDTVSTPGRV
jgi:PAS domain S-box-containing protein